MSPSLCLVSVFLLVPLIAAVTRHDISEALMHSAKTRTAFQRKLAATADSLITVNTSYGELTGVTDGRVTQFLGVPFASPPVGSGRWAPPTAPSKWLGKPKNATWWGKACPQNSLNAYWGLFAGMGEDCLYLNVYMPAGPAPAGGWPVMVWFYGGGFAFGSDSFPVMYDGYNAIASKQANVMIVTVNYRVATIGFLGGEVLQAASPDNSLNWGLQDQQQGLRFTKEVLAPAMGGNPNLITIYGESAGAASVSLFLTNPNTWGMYQRAIMESGPVAPWITHTYASAQAKYMALTQQVGCPQNGTVSVKCMRSLPWENFTALEHGSMDPDYFPVVDGVSVPKDPRTAAAAGSLAPGVSVLLGTNRDEGTSFVPSFIPENLTNASYLALLTNLFGPTTGALAYSIFSPARYGDAWQAYAQAIGDQAMTCPTRDTAQWLRSSKRLGGANASVYTYMYTHVNSVLGFLHPRLGVAHDNELLNVWNVLPEIMLTGPGELELSLLFIRMWSNFAWYGNPNSKNATYDDVAGGVPVWAPFTQVPGAAVGTDTTFIINITDGAPSGYNTLNLRKAECDFWDKYHVPQPPSSPAEIKQQ